MLKLYGSGWDSASAAHWYLEELGVSYEFVDVPLDLENQTHRTPEFLALNPIGKVPVLTDGDFKISEIGAILYYLADKHGRLPDSAEERAVINQWVLISLTEVIPALFVESRRSEAPYLLSVLNQHLDGRSFVVGNALTIADVTVAMALAFARMMKIVDLADYPALAQYDKEQAARPAFQKAWKPPQSA